jgi:hypothetical protein
LPNNSRTAAAIDRDASLEEISERAEEEGLHQTGLSACLRPSRRPCGMARDAVEDAADATETFIHEARKDLPERQPNGSRD